MKRLTIILCAGLIAPLTACETKEGPQQPPKAEEMKAPQGSKTPGAAETKPTRAAETKRTEGDEAKPTDQRAEPDEAKTESTELLKNAAKALEDMKGDEGLSEVIGKAKGLFIVPEYGRAAVGVGARGGEGVLVARKDGQSKDGQWSDPAFYDVGGISVGAQIGAEGGEIAMLLMNDEALRSFEQDDNFSLDAGAKLSIIDYSKLAETPLTDDTDVVFWSDTEGAFGGVSLSIEDISWDDDDNRAFYGEEATAKDVISGKVTAKEPHPLRDILAKP